MVGSARVDRTRTNADVFEETSIIVHNATRTLSPQMPFCTGTKNQIQNRKIKSRQSLLSVHAKATVGSACVDRTRINADVFEETSIIANNATQMLNLQMPFCTGTTYQIQKSPT
jgi:hypothetical protein